MPDIAPLIYFFTLYALPIKQRFDVYFEYELLT